MKNVELLPLSADVTGAKAGSGSNSKPTREDDTTATLAKLSILYGLGEGVVRGFGAGWTTSDMMKRIYLDGTPIMSADGTKLHDVEVDFRDGSLDQSAIEGMPSVTVETAVGIEVRDGNPVARTFLRKEVNSYVVRISIPRLMRNTLEGDSYKNTVSFAIDVASASGSFSEYGQYTITEKISQGFQRDYPVSIPQAATRTLRIRKLTPDGDNSLTFNAITVEAITEVVEVKLRYPHTALLWLKYNARDFNNAPKVEILLDGKADIKIPKNYNPDTRAYAAAGEGTTNGVWNGEFKLGYTDNPVWHWLDLATNKRYGLGNRITIDIPNKFYLYSLAMYCDELVSDGKDGLEPRFTCNNMYLQKQEDAFTVFKDLSSVFRAKTIWDGTHLTPKMDAPRDAMLVFSRANANNISYSSISDAAQHNVIAVQYYDTENHYDSAFAYARSVENIQRRGKIEQIEVTALGCTSEGQAQRIADYLLNTELTETELVSFTTGLDGIRPVVGDVFVFADDLMAGKATSGRVVAVTGAQVTLDRELNPTYDLNGTFIANTTETLASTRKIIAISPDNKTVTLASPIDVVDITGLVWAVKSDSVGLREFTIDDISYSAEDHAFTVSGVLYNRNKYSSSDNAARVVNPPITILQPSTPTSPASVTATYNVVVRQGINISNIDVSWSQVTKASSYEIEMRRDGAEWRKLGTQQSLTMTLDNVYAGTYEFRVRSFDVRGAASVYTQSQPLLVAGKTLPPPMLEQFSVAGELMAVRANWTYPAGTQDSLAVLIEWQNSDPAQGTTNVQKMSVPYPATTYQFSGLGAHAKVWMRAAIVDRNNFNGAFTLWMAATADANPEELIDLISGHISEGTLDQMLKGKIDGALGLAGEANSLASQANATASNAQSAANQASTKAQEAANAVVQEAIDRAAALQDGITQVTTDYKAGDAVVLGDLVAYKTSNDSAMATVVQKAESAVAEGSTNSQAITELTGQVQTINNTKLDATAINNYYTKAESETATAGQLSTFEASLALGGGWMDVGREGASHEIETGLGTIEVIDRMANHFKLTSASDGSFSAYIGYCNNSSDIPVGTPYVLTGKIRASRANLYDRIYCRFNQYGTESYIYDQNASSDWVNFTAKGVTNTGNYSVTDNIIGAYVPYSQVGDWVEFKDCRVSVNSDSLTATNANAIQTVNVEVARVNGEVVSTATDVSNLSSNVGLLQGSINEVRQTVTNNQESTNTLVTSLKSGMADADDVSMMMRNATVLYEDLNFRNGINGISVYNNHFNGALALNFADKLPDNPVASTRQLQFIHSGGQTSPELGGFFQETWSRPNGVFLVKFVAKLPVGFSFGLGHNAYGDGATWYFIGANEGTGKFKTYYGVYRCGATGSFGTVGFVYVQGPYPSPENPLIWYLASSTVYDCLDSKVAPDSVVNGIAEAKSTASTAVNKAEATALIAQNLQATLANTNANISTNYYTKAEAENAVAGKIEQFSSTIAVGGDNLFTGTKTFNNEGSENSNSSFQPSYGGFGQVFMPYGLFGTHMVVRTSSSWSGFYLKEADGVSWEAKEDMVLSFWANADAEVYVYGIASQLGQVALIPANQPMIKYEVLLPKGTPLRNAVNQGLVEFHLPNGGTLWYGAVMLQIGTKSSAWQPSSKESDAAVGSLKNTLTVQSRVIDGVKASYMVKMESNGVVGGFGMIQESGALGAVVTTFGVNADTFYIGSPSLDKKPFVQKNDWTLINGVWVAPGTYIDTAYIANATIGLAHINTASIGSLSALSANLGTFTTTGADGAKQVISGGRTEVFYPSGNIAIKFGVY